MARKPTAWTPLNSQELREVRKTAENTPDTSLVKQYESLHQQAQLVGAAKYPPKPWVIQTLVQIWRELHRRYPRGR